MTNNSIKIPFNKSLLSVAVCMGLLTMTPNAQALVLTASSTTNANGVNDSLTGTDPNYATAYTSSYSTSSDYSYATGKGSDNGWMYSYAGGENIFNSTGSIQQSITITNDTGVAQNYNYNFTINFGSLEAFGYDTLTGSQSVSASNLASITLNGAEIFNSSATLTTNANGSSLSTTGEVLGTYSQGSEWYNWSSYSDTLNLGIFNPGETFTLIYDIFTYASGNVAASDCTGYGFYDGGYGVAGIVEGGYGDYSYGCVGDNAYSQFGDPNGLNSTPVGTNSISSTIASVPEPSALLLLGSGIAGLAFNRRRRQRKA